jgi:inner membrane protein
MTGKHHLIAGCCVGGCLTVSAIISGNHEILPITTGFIGTLIGSAFPDIDTSTSKIGRKVKIISKIINNMFGHRGLFHCPLLIVGLFFLFKYIFETNNITDYNIAYIGFLCGMGIHLTCDMFTKGGIPILYPFYTTKFSLTKMKSGSKKEPIALGFVIILIIITTIMLLINNIFLT